MREMKDSGIEWIGEIPDDWEISTIKREYVFQTGWTPDTSHEEYFIGENIWINISDMKSKVVYDSEKHISDEAIQLASMNISPKGSLLYAFKLSVGAVSFCGMDMYTNEAIATFLPGKNNLRFLYYTAPIFIIKNANENIYGAKLLNQKLIRNAKIVIPPLEVQKRIADYLDRKCSQIDAIIARQQEVIEKLKAYKLSVITEAVTKGLNPDVPMKDSGVEWIGEIPEHWRVIKLKNIVGISDGTHDTPAYVDISETSHPLVTSKCIVNGKIDPSLGNHISQDDYDEINKRSKVHLYDVIMPMIGTVGNPALVLEEPNFAIKNVALLKTRGSLELGKFVLYLLSSNLATVQFDKINRGGVQSFISQEKLKNTIFTLPDSMSEIVVFLDKKIVAIDNVIKQKQTLIDKLIDWKKSLIYEVVTGKKEV